MIKVKHARTAECAVAGFRWHKSGKDAVGSLLLGLYDGRGRLQHVGVTSSFTMAKRKELVRELGPLRERALEGHPWRDWAEADATAMDRKPGARSRWSAGKDLSWEPLRVERVCEVKYDHLQGDRFRHAAVFLRWRPDKRARGLPLRPARGDHALRAGQGLLVGIQRLLSRPQLRRHVLQVHPDPGPGRTSGPASHPPAHPPALAVPPPPGGAPSIAPVRPARPPCGAPARSRSADAWTRAPVRAAPSAARPAASRSAAARGRRPGPPSHVAPTTPAAGRASRRDRRWPHADRRPGRSGPGPSSE